jgi:ankyrin repeat protein
MNFRNGRKSDLCDDKKMPAKVFNAMCEDTCKCNDILCAISRGDKQSVIKILNKRPFLLNRAIGELENTPIYLAAGNGDVDMVHLLCKRKCDLHKANKYGQRPIHYASQEGHNEVIQILFDHGADLNCRANDGKTPLHFAMSNHRNSTVKLLHRLGGDLNAVDEDGASVQMYALDHPDTFRLILKLLARDKKKKGNCGCCKKPKTGVSPERFKTCSRCLIVCYCR